MVSASLSDLHFYSEILEDPFFSKIYKLHTAQGKKIYKFEHHESFFFLSNQHKNSFNTNVCPHPELWKTMNFTEPQVLFVSTPLCVCC